MTDIQTNSVRKVIENSVCLVTGAGGTIGSQLCRQIIDYSPKKLILLDICENGVYELQQEIFFKHGMHVPVTIEIASVRDRDKMEIIFERYLPDIVFHTAAHKHVPLMEHCAEEAVKNNVAPTLNLAETSIKYNVKRFILISTDKAVNPLSVMGATKRCCEMIMKYFASQGGCSFITVRMGNVLGSSGSVAVLFKKQIESGGPVTVTHPDVSRYFITIPQSAWLILKAAANADSGQIYIPKMDKPVKILDLAETMIRDSGFQPYKDIDIKFTGLREGEKLHEQLFQSSEYTELCQDNSVYIGQLPQVPKNFMRDLKSLIQLAQRNDSLAVVNLLHDLVSEK